MHFLLPNAAHMNHFLLRIAYKEEMHQLQYLLNY